jgi:hypothetical protein
MHDGTLDINRANSVGSSLSKWYLSTDLPVYLIDYQVSPYGVSENKFYCIILIFCL